MTCAPAGIATPPRRAGSREAKCRVRDRCVVAEELLYGPGDLGWVGTKLGGAGPGCETGQRRRCQ